MNILFNNGKYFFYNSLDIKNTLETKNYVFSFDGFGNCFLEDEQPFKMPEKLYDVDTDFRSIVKKTFEHNDANMGVSLTGNKGQGKSITAKLLCVELGLPVIIINKPIPSGVDFIYFLKQIQQNYILFIDEFEKLFISSNNHKNDNDNNHSQESFLSFMDGVSTTNNKIMFLLTSNDHINEYLINRPSRIKFLKEYHELPEELFNIIVDDLLINKSYREDLENSVSFLNLNIDLLISIIKDINLLDRPFSTFSNIYNYRFEQYKYELYIKHEGGAEKYESTITLDKQPKIKDRYFCGYNVNNFIKFTKDEIIFESEDYDDKDNKFKITCSMKLCKWNKMSLVF